MSDMWMEKLADGVLELDTPIGPRYLQPNVLQRAILLWTFRNFFSLPQQVLHPWELRLIDRLCARNRFVSMPAVATPDRPIIGRVERRAPAQAEVLPLRRPAESVQPVVAPAVTDDGREVASA
jgi:hypothetical protein